MSRVGWKKIIVPSVVTVEVTDGATRVVRVKGPKGEKVIPLQSSLSAVISNGEGGKKEVVVHRNRDDAAERSLHGLVRSEINNAIIGITEGYKKVLEINGVGYRAAVAGKTITFSLGFSHPILFELPDGIKASVEKNTVLSIEGFDKHLVGQVANKIRALKEPEPYKGKGIKYSDEKLIRKEGKSGKK